MLPVNRKSNRYFLMGVGALLENKTCLDISQVTLCNLESTHDLYLEHCHSQKHNGPGYIMTFNVFLHQREWNFIRRLGCKWYQPPWLGIQLYWIVLSVEYDAHRRIKLIGSLQEGVVHFRLFHQTLEILSGSQIPFHSLDYQWLAGRLRC